MAVSGLWTVLVLHLLWPGKAAPPAYESDCFRMYPHKKLATDREKTFLSVTVEECQEKCLHLHQTSFLCLSFDYIAEESMCIVSPESSYTAPSMLQMSEKADHYERMLDCVHYHVLDTPTELHGPHLKHTKHTKQQEPLKMHVDQGTTGPTGGSIVVDVENKQPNTIPSVDHASMQRKFTLEQDTNKNISSSNSTDIFVLILALQSPRKENTGMKAKHRQMVHTTLEELPSHPRRLLHPASQIHQRESHIDQLWPTPGILERFIRGLQHERAQRDHSHGNPHTSDNLMLQHRQHQQDHDTQAHSEDGNSANSDVRASRAIMHNDGDLTATRHRNHHSAKELHMDDQLTNTMNQELKLHQGLNLNYNEKKQRKKHFAEMKQDDLIYKKYHGRNDNDLKDMHINHVSSPVGTERNRKHESGEHVKPNHAFDHNIELSAKDIESRIHGKHRHSKTSDINEKHLASATQEDIQRVVQEEKIRNQHQGSPYGKGAHILNEHHLQAAEEEDLRRVVHDENHHIEEIDLKSLKVGQRKKEHPVSHKSSGEKDQGHQDRRHERHQRSIHDQMSANSAHEGQVQNSHRNSAQKHDAVEHSDLVNHEQVLKSDHAKKYHSKGKHVLDDAEHAMKKPRRKPSKDSLHVTHQEKPERATDSNDKKNRHKGCVSKNVLNENTMQAAEQEEVLRIQHDEQHPFNTRRQKATRKMSPHKVHINEDHFERARAEDLVRFKHDEMHNDVHPRHVLTEKHLDSANHEELMRIQGEEKHKTLTSHGAKEMHMHLPFNEQHFERANHEELARIRHDEHQHARKYERLTPRKDKHGAQLDAHNRQDQGWKHATRESHGQGLRQDHLENAHREELARMRVDETLLSEEERELREDGMEEESGSGSATGPEAIGSGEGTDQDEGSGSGNWHWGPREVFVEDDRAARTKQLVEDSNVWDIHAD